jgi:hypothetical protein
LDIRLRVFDDEAAEAMEGSVVFGNADGRSEL